MTIILSLLFAFISLQVLAQELPKTSIVIIGQIEGIKDGESFTIMESDGEGRSLHFHKDLPDDNGIIKNGRVTLINVYHRKDVGRFLLIPPEGTYIQQWVGQEIFGEEGTLEKFINQHRTNP